MYYYEVGVRSSTYHGQKPLTYKSESSVAVGTIVEVPLRQSLSLGVVFAEAKLSAKMVIKPIENVFADARLPTHHLQLMQWLMAYYPSPLSAIVQLFLPVKIYDNAKTSSQDVKSSVHAVHPSLPPLTAEQKNVIALFSKNKTSSAVLHGDTGTGKTRVYVELAKKAVSLGRSVIVLTPEIGLAPQLVGVFSAQFPDQIIVLHSGLGRATRDKLWLEVLHSKTPKIIIGPRSALFAPLKNIGLIVVDESHDGGYKQDQSPYYEANRVAAKLASLHNCLCIYGSATPRIADYWHLMQHKIPVGRLEQPISEHIKEPVMQVIDMHRREQFSRSPVFSNALLGALEKNIAAKEQSLIFLNRRGTARLVVCESCGWQATCPQCDIPLAYHGDTHLLRCHVCGFSMPPVTNCPECQSTEIQYQRRGTKSLESELSKHFPQAHIQRFDSDNAAVDTLAKHYNSIIKGEVDILIGTQVLAKGLDIPNLTLVGIPFADTGTYLPDYTADEQTYQLLRQVMGRVGRTTLDSKIIVQTHQPDSPILKQVAHGDWQTFYQNQLKQRRQFNFPPFTYLLQLTCTRKQRASATKAAKKLASEINNKWPSVTVLGPSPRLYEKVQGQYQWQIVIRAPQRTVLLDIISGLPSGWRHNIDPINLL